MRLSDGQFIVPRVAAASYNCICFDYVESCRPNVCLLLFSFFHVAFEG